MLLNLLAVACGGAVGALLRYTTSTALQTQYPAWFPLPTLLLNALGSLLMGLLFVLLVERQGSGWPWRELAMVGFLGALTTYSTFALELVRLWEAGQLRWLLAYWGLTSGLCPLLAGLGLLLGRRLLA